MSEPVEIKVTIDTFVDDAVDRLCQGAAETGRLVYFLELRTPDARPALPLLDAGIVLRLRSNDTDKDDSTVKLRPCVRSQLTDDWQKDFEKPRLKFRIEQDWAGPRRSLAASCVAKFAADTVRDVARDHRQIAEVFTEKQLDFLTACGSIHVPLARLTLLGPIQATKWEQTSIDDAVAERWTVGDLDFLELSIRCDDVADAESRQSAFEAALRGYAGGGAPTETKTRLVLEYLSNHRGAIGAPVR
ncbi:MAG TPA: hypothetical protein VIT65_07365 [Microlunatus sp.]